MYLSKRNTILLLFSLYCWGLVMRYPDINGPHDSDSSLMQWMSLKFIHYGNNPWILSTYSYFGMYPFSYPFGISTYLSVFNQLTGLNPEISILFLGWFFSFIGINSMFILSKEFGGNDFAFFAALSFSTAHYFVNYTFWSISARGLYLVLIPLFIFLTIRVISNDRRYNALFIIFYLLLLSTHRSAIYLFIVVFLPLTISKLIFWYNSKSLGYANMSNRFRYIYVLIIAILFFLSLYGTEYINSLGLPLQKNWIVERYTGRFIAPLLNFAFRITTTHILSIFGLIGLLSLLLRGYNSKNQVFLYIILLLSSPFFADYEYFTPTILPVICLFSALGITYSIRVFGKMDKRSPIIILLCLLIMSSSFEYYILELNTHSSAKKHNPDNLEGYGTFQETRNNANWIREYIPTTSIVMDGYHHSHYSSLVLMSTLRQRDLIADNENYGNYLVIEPLGFFDTFFHQKKQFFGAEVYTVSDSEVYKSSVIFEIYNDPEHRYVDVFELEYVTEPPSGEKWFLDAESLGIEKEETPPFFLELHDSSYRLHSNELLEVYFFYGDH